MKHQSTQQEPIYNDTTLSALCLREANCGALKEGADFLSALPNNLYGAYFKPAFQATIGAHYRHILEHYRCFLGQMESGLFNYDERARDALLEREKQYAMSTITTLIENLNALEFDKLPHSYKVADHYAEMPIVTNLARELAFLQSHTVHHFAMIAAIARGLGVDTEAGFGVAIATINYQQSQAEQ